MLSFWNHDEQNRKQIRLLNLRRGNSQIRRKRNLPGSVLGVGERLEERTLLTTFTVTNISDDASTVGSLRNVINQANAQSGADVIVFDDTVFAGVVGITLGGTELPITDSVRITGPGPDRLTINANQQSRIFKIDDSDNSLFNSIDVVISGLSLTGGNTAGPGGAIFNKENLSLIDSVISGNTAGGNDTSYGGGGGLYSHITSGSLQIVNCSFLLNTSQAPGGGLYMFTGGFATSIIQNSSVTGNSSTQSIGGGGIASNNIGGETTILNSTVTGNSANSGGGVGIVTTSGKTIIQSSTISGNSAISDFGFGGGVGIFNSAGPTEINSTIIAGNNAITGTRDIYAQLGSAVVTFSLIGDNTGSNLDEAQTADGSGNLIGTSSNPIDPLLGTLQPNGGRTNTRALLPGSPAIGAGAFAGVNGTPTIDQRGFIRPSGQTDMGAFDSRGTSPFPETPSNFAISADTDTGTLGDGITSNPFPTITGKAESGTGIYLFEVAGEDLILMGFGTTVDGMWSVSVDTSFTPGAHFLKAFAQDVRGMNSPLSEPFLIIINAVDTTPPNPPAHLALDPSSDSGVQGDRITEETLPAITGTAEPGSTVKLKADGNEVGTAVAVGGDWTITLTSPLSLGTHVFTATATDSSNNTSSVSNSLSLTIVAPVPTTDTSTAGAFTPPSFFKAPEPDNSVFVVDVAPGVLDTFHNAGSFTVNLPIDRYFGDFAKLRAAGLLPATVQLQLPAFDVDFSGLPTPERDRISINGHSLQAAPEGEFLKGLNNTWRLNTFTVPIEFLNLPNDPGVGGTLVKANNQIKIDVDTNSAGWLTSVDWVSLKIEAPNPVFLVHGLLSSSSAWNDAWVQPLTGLGVPVGTVELRGHSPNATIDSMANNAEKIDAAITALQHRWGFHNITIVGQSKGGLDARQYTENLLFDDNPENDELVSALIEIGTPNGGTSLNGPAFSGVLTFAAELGLQDLISISQIAGAPELDPQYLAAYNAVHGNNPNTTYWSLASIYNAPSSDLVGQFLADLSPNLPDDTIVTTESAWTTIDPAHRLTYTSSGNDAFSVGREGTGGGQMRSQGIYNLLLPLVLRSSLQASAPYTGPGTAFAPAFARAAQSLTAPSLTAQSLPSAMPGTGTVTGLVGILGTDHKTVVLDDGAPAYVSLTYYGGKLDLTLTSPSGVEIQPNDPGVEFDESNGDFKFVVYKFMATEGGLWNVKIHNNSIIPQPYILNGWFPTSTLTMSAQVDQNAYAAGDSILVTAFVSDGVSNVTGQTVTAQVFDPSFAKSDLPLFDDGLPEHGDSVAGDGVFSNRIADTNRPGVYQIIARAEGNSPTMFSRQSQTIAEVANVTASLTGTFADSTFDANDNGLADQLVIEAGIDVSAPGFFRVLGELRDAEGQLIDEASFAGTLTPADHQVALVFDGQRIFNSGASGPYTLTLVRLAQESGNVAVLVQELTPAYQTQAYNRSSFEHGSIFATGIISEIPVDLSTPANDKIDQLNIAVEVEVATGGTYEYSAHLVDGKGNVVGSFASTSTLTAGTNTLSFSFNGATIGSNRANGPYRLTDLVLASETDGAVIAQGFTTQTYLASQFEGFSSTAIPINLDLVAASDTGNFTDDNFTGDTTPTVTVSADPGTTVVFHVNGTDVPGTESTAGVYTATFAQGVIQLGSNSITATSSGTGGTSPASTPLVIQLAAPQTTRVASGGTLLVTQPNGKVVTVSVTGALTSATVTTLSNSQMGEITTIAFSSAKSKAKGAGLTVSTPAGGTGFVGSISSATSLLETLSLTNISVRQVQINGSLGTLTLAGTSVITTGMNVTANVTTISASQWVLGSVINVTGNLGTASFAGTTAGSAINVAKTLKTLNLAGNSNLVLSGKKVTTITSRGTMDGTYRVKSITAITSTGVFRVNVGTSKITKITAPRE